MRLLPTTLRSALATATIAALTAAAVVAVPAAATPRPVAAPDVRAATVSGHLVLSGRGWGHGRGMGQWGSFGLAVDHAWTSGQILAHFYGGTTASTVSPVSPMSVRLLANDGQPLMAQVSGTGIAWIGPSGVPVGATGQAVRIESLGVDRYRISDAPTCAGPWTARRTIDAAQIRVRAADLATGFSYGTSSDVALSGDWDGDGVDTIGVRRGNQFLLRNSNSGGGSDLSFAFGAASDVPLVGDWDGDGVDTIGVRRGNVFKLRNSNSGGGSHLSFGFGAASDVPLVGDWDGDGVDTIGVRRGNVFKLRNSNSGGGSHLSFSFGTSADVPVTGDWDDDGDDTIGVRRGDQWILRNANSSGPSSLSYRFGSPGGATLTGRWSGTADFAGQRNGSTFLLATGHGSAAGGVRLRGDNEPLSRTLQLCRGSTRTWYRGELRAANFEGAMRSVNVVAVDQYLRGVVPRESPASWGDAGGGSGMNALRAQAVAARSYSMSEARYPYAKTCDTISCQVYGGAATSSGGSITTLEHPNTDRAINDTAGSVRRIGTAIARTEFSSSTGGVTAGGTFPSVVDAGDDTISNPHHFWVTTIPHSSLSSRYGQTGFRSAAVTARTDADGNRRVEQIRLVFDSGTVFRTGAEFRSDWGLKETWFYVGAPPGADTVGTRETSSSLFRLNNFPISGTSAATFNYGASSDIPLAGDWNDDGRDTIGVWRAGTFLLRNSNSGGGSDVSVTGFGLSTDHPIVGDWDGDGDDTIGVKRDNTYYVRNANSDGPSAHSFGYGLASDVPVVGDWNGDGTETIGVYRSGTFYLRNSLSAGGSHLTIATGVTGRPVAGDWDGDGIDNVGVYSGGVFTLLLVNQTGSRTLSVQFGTGLPLAGDWF